MQSSVALKKQFKRPGARVRASFTLENVFLIPLFTMIIVFLMGAGLYLHDNIIIKNALIQGTVILEKNILKEAGEEQTGFCNYISAQSSSFADRCSPIF